MTEVVIKCFMQYRIHEESLELKKDTFKIVKDVLDYTGVLVSPSFIELQQRLYVNPFPCFLSRNKQMVLECW